MDIPFSFISIDFWIICPCLVALLCYFLGAANKSKSIEKRAAELRDELLFKQPESTHVGDCPICCLPLSFDCQKSILQACCSKSICNGCFFAYHKRENETSIVPSRCPFCRKDEPKTEEENDRQMMKRIEANDPVALCQQGAEECDKGNYRKALEYLTKAAELGNANAHCRLLVMYLDGEGVEKDARKALYHMEEAAIGGHPVARHNLGCCEWNNQNAESAVKHWVIAATQGYDDSTKELMVAFKEGLISKEDLAAALRAHQAAVDATKSPQREYTEGRIAYHENNR